jgi:hypothetical protein
MTLNLKWDNVPAETKNSVFHHPSRQYNKANRSHILKHISHDKLNNEMQWHILLNQTAYMQLEMFMNTEIIKFNILLQKNDKLP